MDGQTKIIAVAGKGGVGKTSLSAVIVKLLVENFPNKRILAIDADPAIGLSTALGVEPKKTIDDVRKVEDRGITPEFIERIRPYVETK